ncbi:MAG TPA: hypothetical protein VHO25_11465, partial [Polyangiaceae bacterium]|nr:hypothetical protein [Polyangiaceae bacterium]
MNGTVNPNGVSTSSGFRYGTTNPGTCDASFGQSTGSWSQGSGSASVSFSVTGVDLVPDTTYYFCATATNSYGTSFGAVLSFTSPEGAPLAYENGVTSLTGSGAVLNGLVDPGGAATQVWFRYSAVNPGSCNDSFGTRVPSTGGTNIGSGTEYVDVSRTITGLTQNTTYYFCVIAENSVGKNIGWGESFTTPVPPTAVTDSAYSVTNTSATLYGYGNPNRGETTGWFRYSATDPGGCNDSFGTRAPSSGGSDLGWGTWDMSFQQSLTGLAPATTYYFCAITQNSEGKAFGAVLSFRTRGAPTLTTSAETLLTATTVTLNGTVNPNGVSTSSGFRYGTVNPGTCNSSFGSATSSVNAGSGTSAIIYNRPVTGLMANTTYYFCATATNSYGTSFGAVMSFTTLPEAPITNTSSATILSGTTAVLNGYAYPGGATTLAWFRYSTVNPGTCNDTFGIRAPTSGDTNLGSGINSVSFFENVTGLTPNTTYYFCAIAQNSVAKTFGYVTSFSTATAPTASTDGVTSLTNTSVTLNGFGLPNRAATTGWFRYSLTDPGNCNDTFGTRAPASGGSSLGAGSNYVSFTRAISGLSATTTYYFCAITENSEGKAFSDVGTF